MTSKTLPEMAQDELVVLSIKNAVSAIMKAREALDEAAWYLPKRRYICWSCGDVRERSCPCERDE